MLRLLLLALIITWTFPAAAQDARGTQFEELVREGVESFAAGQYEAALASFQQAHHRRPSARTHRAIGLCHFELGSYREAVIHLEAATVTTVNPLTQSQLASAQEALADAYERVGRFELRVSPRSADVTVDGERVGADARLVLPAPGTYVLEASADGYISQRQRIEVIGGETEDLSLLLEPGRDPGLDVPPDDGASSGRATTATPAGPNVGAIVSFSIGGAGLLLTAVTGPLALTEKSALEDFCGEEENYDRCVESHPDYDGDRFASVERLALIADLGLVIAGAGALAGAMFLIFASDPEEEVANSWLLVPSVDATSVGLRALGSF